MMLVFYLLFAKDWGMHRLLLAHNNKMTPPRQSMKNYELKA
jgi:hypothetical protein